MRVFYESEGKSHGFGGYRGPPRVCLFPAADSPENNFDVWVIAGCQEPRRISDGKPLVGKSYLVVTVPVYTFNGRRYVRDLDRWVDDGPARPPFSNRKNNEKHGFLSFLIIATALLLNPSSARGHHGWAAFPSGVNR